MKEILELIREQQKMMEILLSMTNEFWAGTEKYDEFRKQRAAFNERLKILNERNSVDEGEKSCEHKWHTYLVGKMWFKKCDSCSKIEPA